MNCECLRANLNLDLRWNQSKEISSLGSWLKTEECLGRHKTRKVSGFFSHSRIYFLNQIFIPSVHNNNAVYAE